MKASTKCHLFHHRGSKENSGSTYIQKRNYLIEYLKENKTKFRRRMIVVIDDVDLVPEELVLALVEELFGQFQAATIIKWLAIRQVTYESYGRTAKEQIDTFFPHVYRFPDVPLYDIASQRVGEVMRKDGVNPFGQQLCQIVEDLHNGDHRQGLAVLEELLRENPPGNIRPGVSFSFIDRYMKRMVLKVCIDRGSIPNVFAPSGNVNGIVPLPKEVMALGYFKRRVDGDFVRFINESLTTKCGGVRGVASPVTLRFAEIIEAVLFLQKLDLIERVGKTDFRITPRGRLMQLYLNQDYYIDTCRGALGRDARGKIFWMVAGIESDFEQTMMLELFRRMDRGG